MKAIAISPAHITGFFQIYPNGSTGTGINLDKGMITTVAATPSKKNSVEIYLNGKNCPCNTSRTVAKKMLSLTHNKFNLIISHETIYPIGYGLGISGSGALSLSLALNKALKLKLSKQECLEIAKQAEIENGTGLGDVIAEQFAGVMLGAKPYPSKTVIPIKCPYKFIVCGFFAPIKTKSIIHSNKWKKKINEEGKKCMNELNKEKTFHELMKLSREFSFATGLPSKKLLNALNHFPFSSMAMLGQTIFIPTKNPSHAQKHLKEFTSRTMIARIAEKGAKIL